MTTNVWGMLDYERANELTEMSVGFPTPVAMSLVYGDSSGGSVYWKFKPTKSGRVAIDAFLSFFVDPEAQANSQPYGPSVSLTVTKGRYDRVQDKVLYGDTVASSGSWYDTGANPPLSRSQGRVIIEVEAGATYFIQLYGSTAEPRLMVVPRIGEIKPAPDWVQPDDLQIVFAPDSTLNVNMVPSTHQPTIMPRINDNTGNNLSTNLQFGSIAQDDSDDYYSTYFSWGYEGKMGFSRAFGGPIPAVDPAAHPCSWNYTRKGQYGTGWWWSIYNGASWNGTDPYNPDIPGYGNCPVLNTSAPQSCGQRFTEAPIGAGYISDTSGGFFTYSDMYYRAFAASQTVNPWNIRNRAGKSAYGIADQYGNTDFSRLPYGRTLRTGEYVEWESTMCDIIHLEGGPDDLTTSRSGPEGDVDVIWYVHPSPYGYAPGSSGTIQQEWGPAKNGWVGGAGGPDTFPGRAQEFARFPGDRSFKAIPRDLWENPTQANRKTFRITGVPDFIYDTEPPDMPGEKAQSNISLYRYRNYTYIAIRATLRPSRYKLYEDPGTPDITWEGEASSEMNFRDEGRVLY